MATASNAIPFVNPVQRDTEFKLGEAVYWLRYDFTAIAAFERGTGINPVTHGIGTDPVTLVAFLWAGLRHHHPEVSFETVESWFTSDTAAALYSIAYRAFNGALPEASADGEGGSLGPIEA